MSQYNQYQTPQSQVDRGSVQQFSEPKVFGVSGRIGRVRYLAYSIGVSFAVMVVAAMISGAFSAVLGDTGALIGGTVLVIAYIFVIVYSFMVAIQRSHDFNSSGWMSLLILIPLVSLIFLFIPGTQGENNYGAPPPPNSVGNIILALLLPIIAIIGILAAIAIPAYQGYVQKSQEMQQQQQYEQPR
jgi:uncharacterized membrane protein YhaH (DUF805 family)